jgi:acetyltransferase-like isoleucine patch superfamily enzyme
MAVKRNEGHRASLARKIVMRARGLVIDVQLWYFRRVLGMEIGSDVRISLKARMDFTNPTGIHIGDSTYIAFDAIIFAHDMTRVLHTDTYIGKCCFIGAQAIIMAGVRVGDHCIVGSGAVVTKDVPPNSIVAGNPATIIRSGVNTTRWGMLVEHYVAAGGTLPEDEAATNAA